MTARLIARGCVAVLFALLYAGTMEPVRAQGPDIGTEAQRESGKTLYVKNCSQCHGEKGDGVRLCHSAPVPQAPGLHGRQVQGSDDS